jgi:tetratricopeptide (TPR) repeat protein
VGTGHPFLRVNGFAARFESTTGQSLGEPLRHERAVTAVAYTPDGQQFLTASLDGQLRIWDARSGAELGSLLHPDGVTSAAFSPDGRLVFSGCADKQLRVWDSASGELIGEPFRHPDKVLSLGVSESGETLVAGTETGARIWNVRTGRPIGNLLRHKQWVRGVAISPDGQTVLTGSADRTAQAWDVHSGRAIDTPLKHDDWVTGVAFSVDGAALITASTDKSVRIWSVQAPLAGSVERITLAAQVASGAALDQDDVAKMLDADIWLERSARLHALGGFPEPRPTQGESIKELRGRGSKITVKARNSGFRAGFPFGQLKVDERPPADFFARRARASAASARWQEASLDFAKAVELAPGDSLYAFEHAGSQVIQGDSAAYARACERMLERFGNSADHWEAYSVARTCLLAPWPGMDVSRLERLGQQAADHDPPRAYVWHTLGLAALRANKHDEAIRRLLDGAHREPRWPAMPINWLALAVAHKKLGHEVEAQEWVRKAIRSVASPSIDAPGGSGGPARYNLGVMHPHDVVAYQVLLREAKSLGIIALD